MSNQKCPRCGKSYPSSYRSCPYCSGRNRRRRSAPAGPVEQIAALLRDNGERIFLGCTAVFLLIAVLGMILTQCAARPDPAPVPDDSVQQPAEEDPQPVEDPLTISTSVLSLSVGEAAVLTVEGGTEELLWASSNEEVAGVAEGTVTANAPGTATITASCGTQRVACTVTVKEKDPDVEVYLNRTDFTLSSKFPTFQMEVKVRETRKAYEGGVVWSIEDPSVATISETGLVERVGRGTTTVTATMGTKVLECIVRVS